MPWPTASADAMHSFGAGFFVAAWTDDVEAVAIAPAAGTELSGIWSEVGQMINADTPERTPGDTKITHTKSPQKANEYIPGWVEAGQANVRLHYNLTTFNVLQSLMPSANAVAPQWDRHTWAVQLPDGGCFFFSGYLKGSPVRVPGADSDDPVAIDVMIKISGDVWFDS
jgi:hypothetical protein